VAGDLGARWRLRNPERLVRWTRYNPIMHTTLQGLHDRYRLQATWTESIRERLLSEFGFEAHAKILEVGSGTGVITGELSRSLPAGTYGVDIDPKVAAYAATQDVATHFAAADGRRLPFPDDAFDACACHYLLLWVSNPEAVLREMARVTRSGGRVFAFAEPDYRGRIDHPPGLVVLGALQAQSLEAQGADPAMGRKIRGLFGAAGLVDIQAGVLGGEWDASESLEVAKSEWEMIRMDLPGIDSEQLAAYRQADDESRRSGERILYVPTFYASGKVP
jgi:SAM-dependent methyltransferase